MRDLMMYMLVLTFYEFKTFLIRIFFRSDGGYETIKQ